jgi:methionine synthase I (cobalamin-dependent)
VSFDPRDTVFRIQRIMIIDGAMGTVIQQYKLEVCPIMPLATQPVLVRVLAQPT